MQERVEKIGERKVRQAYSEKGEDKGVVVDCSGRKEKVQIINWSLQYKNHEDIG